MASPRVVGQQLHTVITRKREFVKVTRLVVVLYLFAMRLLAGHASASRVATVDGKNRDLQCKSWIPNGLFGTKGAVGGAVGKRSLNSTG